MKRNTVLIAIIILAAILRFWRLDSNPPSLYWDEVSLGYNAYSILKTGRDEHGEFLPLARFIAFGDYKPPGYIYATVPSIAIFGLNEFAVRFPSALAGTLTVLLTYFLVKELFGSKSSVISHQSSVIAAIAALLLAISPWHLQFSRGAFEANLATFFSVAGVYFFLKGTKYGKYLVVSALFFVLSVYTFNTHRVFVPLLLLGMVLLSFKKLTAQRKFAIPASILGFILVIPLIPFLLSREGQLRFQEVTIFRNLDPIVTANERIEREGNTLWARAVHNRRVQFALEFAKHYTDHFRADFLFFSGDVNPRLGTRDHGVLFPIEIPLLLLGTFFLVKMKTPASYLLFFWIFVAIMPAATARETPHALRTMNLLPVPQILTAVGVVSLFQIIKRKKLYTTLLVTCYLLLVTSYLHTYHVHYPKKWAASWQFGYKQAVEIVSSLQDDYDRVFFTRKYGRPYIFLLFHQKYPPLRYWESKDSERDWYGFQTVKGFDKYRFGDIPLNEFAEGEKWLLVTGPDGMPKEARPMTKVLFPDGETAFEIGEMQ